MKTNKAIMNVSHSYGHLQKFSKQHLPQPFFSQKTWLFLPMVIFFLFASKAKAMDPTDDPQFYVSPTGSSSGNGTLNNPWDLQTALNQPSAVVPGSTIWLKPGTYHGTFISSLTGTAAKPIVLRNEEGRAIIDGSRAGETIKNVTTLVINGAYTWYMGFEVTNSDPVRVISQSGSNPPERRGEGVSVFGVGVKLINLVIYDTGQGISAWTPAENSEYYGNVIFNNGWWAPDREHGHGVYTQNNTGTKRFLDNIVLNNFSYGWQTYGSANASLKNYYLEGNTMINDRWLFGGYAPMQNVELNGNYTFKDSVEFGYDNTIVNDGLILRNNVFSSRVFLSYWNNVSATNNTFFTGQSYGYPITFTFNGPPDVSSFNFNNNTYFWSNPPSAYQPELALNWVNFPLADTDPNRRGSYTYTQWRQMGKDANSTIQTYPLIDDMHYAVTGKKIIVKQNIYDPKRANIIIYNWDNSDAVDVDVTGILAPGDNYEIHNVQNYFGDIATGTYYGGLLPVPMANHTVAKPLGYNFELGQNTQKLFGAFVLVNTSAGVVLPVNFLSFNVSQQNRTALLQWSTSAEQSVAHYSIERSADGNNFNPIGNVDLNAGAQLTNNYEFIDPSPLRGTSYYRIKEVDLNNQFSYSEVRKLLNIQKGFSYTLVQNPANDYLKLSLNLEKTAKLQFQIRDAAGHLLINEFQSLDRGSNAHQISVASLPNGSYFLSIKGAGQSETTSFIKQ